MTRTRNHAQGPSARPKASPAVDIPRTSPAVDEPADAPTDRPVDERPEIESVPSVQTSAGASHISQADGSIIGSTFVANRLTVVVGSSTASVDDDGAAISQAAEPTDDATHGGGIAAASVAGHAAAPSPAARAQQSPTEANERLSILNNKVTILAGAVTIITAVAGVLIPILSANKSEVPARVVVDSATAAIPRDTPLVNPPRDSTPREVPPQHQDPTPQNPPAKDHAAPGTDRQTASNAQTKPASPAAPERSPDASASRPTAPVLNAGAVGMLRSGAVSLSLTGQSASTEQIAQGLRDGGMRVVTGLFRGASGGDAIDRLQAGDDSVIAELGLAGGQGAVVIGRVDFDPVSYNGDIYMTHANIHLTIARLDGRGLSQRTIRSRGADTLNEEGAQRQALANSVARLVEAIR